MKIGLFCGLTLLCCLTATANEYTELKAKRASLEREIKELGEQKVRAIKQIENEISKIDNRVANPLRWVIYSFSYNINLKDEKARLQRKIKETELNFNNRKAELENRREEVKRDISSLSYRLSVYMKKLELTGIPDFDAYKWGNGQADLRIYLDDSLIAQRDKCPQADTTVWAYGVKLSRWGKIKIKDKDGDSYEDMGEIELSQIFDHALNNSSENGKFSGTIDSICGRYSYSLYYESRLD